MLGRWTLLVLMVVYVGWLIPSYEYHFLDGVNLAIHETSHFVFMPFGKTLYFLGGTLGQLIFPAIFVAYFLMQGQRFEVCVMLVWFAESMMYAAVYIEDAQAQRLPLVGGHIHDWHWLLSQWGMLNRCELIGSCVHVLASMIAVSALLMAGGTLIRQRAKSTSTEPH